MRCAFTICALSEGKDHFIRLLIICVICISANVSIILTFLSLICTLFFDKIFSYFIKYFFWNKNHFTLFRHAYQHPRGQFANCVASKSLVQIVLLRRCGLNASVQCFVEVDGSIDAYIVLYIYSHHVQSRTCPNFHGRMSQDNCDWTKNVLPQPRFEHTPDS